VEALNGTLRAAKRQKKVCHKYIQSYSPEAKAIFQVTFNAELLMMPKDKDVQVVWLE